MHSVLLETERFAAENSNYTCWTEIVCSDYGAVGFMFYRELYIRFHLQRCISSDYLQVVYAATRFTRESSVLVDAVQSASATFGRRPRDG